MFCLSQIEMFCLAVCPCHSLPSRRLAASLTTLHSAHLFASSPQRPTAASRTRHPIDMQPVPHAVSLNMQPYYNTEQQVQVGHVKSNSPLRSAAAQQPKDYVLWSLCNLLCLDCCFCISFAALVNSIKSRDRKVLGDPEGAARYGKKAKCLNITTLILSIVTFIIMAVIIISNPAEFQKIARMMK